MKKQTIGDSNSKPPYINHTTLDKKRSLRPFSSFLHTQSGKPTSPKEGILNYVFYCDQPSQQNYAVIQFRKLVIENSYYLNIKQQSNLNDDEINNFINYTYIPSDNLHDTLAQILVDFMISQPDALLIIEKDTGLFQVLLKSLWKEFTALFDVQGLYDGSWVSVKPDLDYKAYSLRRKSKL
ncbi:MAG: hypothetical protein M5Z89_02830 [Olivibacter sp.]|nr:hypothetical protein [Olivibacter sp. UJ_SKK_5.1]